MQDIFEDLNSVQKEAVDTTEGALLVLAGAGTGKTKVLTTRIANIIMSHLAYPSEVLAVTFTNKAAKEMRDRIASILPVEMGVDSIWIGTFHSIGLRIIRQHVEEAGLKSNFTILDQSDCERLVRDLLIDANVDTKKYPPSMVANKISGLKDKNIVPEKVPDSENEAYGISSLSTIYKNYNKRLRELNSVDFGDLLQICVILFRTYPEILEKWQAKFKYILIDEYQDTNSLQYTMIRILASRYQNICCVGDDDQSIYSWRGAEIENILKFEKDFLGAKVLRLEQNYRSTAPILKVASSIISANSKRWDKVLWTDMKNEGSVKIFPAFNSKEEAQFICDKITYLKRNGVKAKDMAILVRGIFQTRELEERLTFNGIDYNLVGGLSFYNRAEIKDITSYLRLYYQKYDDMAFLRIINTPKRGIGDSSINKIRAFALDNSMSLYHASEVIIGHGVVSAKVENALNDFVGLFNSLEQQEAQLALSLQNLTKRLVEDSGYMDMYLAEKTEEAKNKIENIKELIHTLGNYETLQDFLEHIALVLDKEETADLSNKISMMTLHRSKGLEFDYVFLPGWEEGVLPHQRSLDEGGLNSLEEERRLAYVGVTRAKKELVISYAKNRYMYGSWQEGIPSRFIAEAGNLENITTSVFVSNDRYKKASVDKASWANNVNDMLSNSTVTAVKVGSEVVHNTMGNGVVLSIMGVIAEVQFDLSVGKKKIMVSFLRLKE